MVLGQTGSVSLQSAQITAYAGSATNPAHLQLYNESGVGFRLSFTTGGSQYFLPAGGWLTVPLTPGESTLNYVVAYVMQSQPVSQLEVLYFAPGETVTSVGTLGNSPIGISGAVTTSSVQTLSNEGNPVNTLVIDMGPSGNAQIIEFWNDHFLLSVVQSGVVHNVLRGQVTGNELIIGATGDIAEVASQLSCDAGITSAAATDMNINAPTGKTINLQNNGVTHCTIGNTGVLVPDNTIFGSTGVRILDGSGGSDLFLNPVASGAGHKIGLATNSTERFRVDDNGVYSLTGAYHFVVGSMNRQNGADNTGCGAGTTISHGVGITPAVLVATPQIVQAGSATVGVGNIGSTTFQATVGAGSNINWWAMAG
jgi:hypothetical protein